MTDGDRPCVAILGGGQLGRMLGLAGIPLGLRFRFLDPQPDAPARRVGDLVVGELAVGRALDRVVRGASVVSFEWEGVPAEAARHAAATVAVWPPPRALEVSQDRLREKELFGALGVATAEYAPVSTRDELDAAVERVGLPAILKTRQGGYDGKGQLRLITPDDLDACGPVLHGRECILEAVVAFDRELSILGVRGADGEARCWPVVENHHHHGILRLSLAPAPGWSPELQERAEAIARRVMDHLDYRGVLCVELFEVGDRLLANELAPRVHNSGHWTIEGAATSQFENHLRAVLGWPLGRVGALGSCAMLNLIGEAPSRGAVMALPDTHWHDYEKSPRPGRKLGHVTVTAADENARAGAVARLQGLIDAEHG
jgi:5-(carboxyamino)imidazole ribonucleotide synthase